MKRFLILLIIAVLALAACGSDDGDGEAEGDRGECSEAPAALADGPELPPDFPTPDGVTYTGVEEAGPSTIVEGYYEGSLDEAFDTYKGAFEDASYDITKEEQEEDDAEVFFSGGGTTGQVDMEVPCEDRTELRITIRPA